MFVRAEREAGPLGVRALRENNPKLLRKLLSLCFTKFHSVVQAHAVLLSHLHRAKKVYNGESVVDPAHVWLCRSVVWWVRAIFVCFFQVPIRCMRK